VVGLVLAPKGSESALGPAFGGGVGSVSYYRYVEGQDTTVSTGQLKLTGASLANQGGGPDDVLVAAGQVMLTGPITEVGYAQVIVAGQLVAPATERAALEPKLQVQGQTLWYRGAEPRVITDDMVIGPDFFRLLDEPVSLVLLGDVTFQPGRHRGPAAGETGRPGRAGRRDRTGRTRVDPAGARLGQLGQHPGGRWTGSVSSSGATRRTGLPCTPTSWAGPATGGRRPT
jgi:hypothetical protein